MWMVEVIATSENCPYRKSAKNELHGNRFFDMCEFSNNNMALPKRCIRILCPIEKKFDNRAKFYTGIAQANPATDPACGVEVIILDEAEDKANA